MGHGPWVMIFRKLVILRTRTFDMWEHIVIWVVEIYKGG